MMESKKFYLQYITSEYYVFKCLREVCHPPRSSITARSNSSVFLLPPLLPPLLQAIKSGRCCHDIFCVLVWLKRKHRQKKGCRKIKSNFGHQQDPPDVISVLGPDCQKHFLINSKTWINIWIQEKLLHFLKL